MRHYLATRLPAVRWSLWFCCANALLAGLISIRFLGANGSDLSAITSLFLGTQLIAHYSVMVVAAVLLLAPLALLIPSHRVMIGLAIALLLPAQVVLLGDSFVFLQYRFHLNGFMLDLMLNDTDGQIFDFSWVAWLTALGATLGLLLLELGLAVFIWRQVQRVRHIPYSYTLAASLLVITLGNHLAHIWADANAYGPIVRYSKLLPLAHPATAYKQMRKWGWADAEAHQQQAMLKEQGGSSALDYPRQPLSCSTPERPLNLLLVVLDSWRADMLNPEVMPNLSRFSAQGTRFNNHFSGSNSTRAGVFSLFYGLPGQYWQAFNDTQTPPVLISQLLAQQYQMGIFSSARLDNPRFNRTVFQPLKDLRLQSEGDSPWQRDQNLVTDWRHWYHQQRDRNRPYFGFLFFDAAHGVSFPPDYDKPFQPSWERVNHLLLNDGFDPAPYFNRYRNAVHYIDSLLKPVLSDLEQSGELDHTVVLITADHGEEFNDNRQGYWGHNGNFSPTQVQVPLVVHWPGRGLEPASSERWTSHYDLVPTLMQDLLGCSTPAEAYSIGQNLFSAERDWLLVASYSQYAIVEPQQVTAVDPLGNFTLYDHRYQPLPDATLNRTAVLEAVKTLSQFYRR